MKILKLNREIYFIQNIQEALLAYKDYADINIKESATIVELSFKKCLYDENMTVREFENYLIGLENS